VPERRTYARISIDWRVIVVMADGQKIEGRAKDVSLGGMTILSDDVVLADEQCHVYFMVPREKKRDGKVEAVAKVVYTVLAHNMCKFRSGLQFTAFSEHGKAMLEEYLAFRATSLLDG